MKKINNLATQFPNIFRIIPESKLFEQVLKSKPLFYFFSGFMVIVSIMLVLTIVIFGVELNSNLKILIKVTNQREELKAKINFWQSITDKYEGYKDAYFQIAVSEYRLGDLRRAKQANIKALLLDPNFEDAKKLDNLIDKNN
jgi:hypothetical protein